MLLSLASPLLTALVYRLILALRRAILLPHPMAIHLERSLAHNALAGSRPLHDGTIPAPIAVLTITPPLAAFVGAEQVPSAGGHKPLTTSLILAFP